MRNLYTTSLLLSKEKFLKLEKALNNSWGKDTTNPDVLHEWSVKNKAYGQCAITAVIIYDLFGGKIIYDKKNYHVWNELPDGTHQDLSREQFNEDRVFNIYKYLTKEVILSDETGIRLNSKQRYYLLKKRIDVYFKNESGS